MTTTSYIKYLLHLADNALILGHRNSEWCGHGPVLEQDIAISNIALDLLGQARNFYQHAAELFNALPATAKQQLFVSNLITEKIATGNIITEDDFAYLRNQEDYYNFVLVELPKGNWAVTILRQYFFASFSNFLFTNMLSNSTDQNLKAIAAKSLKEINYHITWSADWLLRLGDGTTESNIKMQEAVNNLWPYAINMFNVAPYEKELLLTNTIADITAFKNNWQKQVTEKILEATLTIPETKPSWLGDGKSGIHTENLSYILGELQVVHRAHPNSLW